MTSSSDPMLRALPPVEEVTQTHFLRDEEATNRFSWDTDEPTLRQLGPDQLEEVSPGDELGLDRPIFPPPPTGQDTRVDIDLALVAAIAVPESPPAPIDDKTPVVAPVPSHLPPPEVLFEVGGIEEPAASLGALAPALVLPARSIAARRFSSAAFPPHRLYVARPQRKPLIWVIVALTVLVVAGSVVALVATLSRHRAATPRALTAAPSLPAQRPPVDRTRLAAPAAVADPLQARVDTLARKDAGKAVAFLLPRARASLEHEDYATALAEYGRVRQIAPTHSEARAGQARAAVELGQANALSDLGESDAPLRDLLAVRLAMVQGNWAGATRLLVALPRPVRHQPQQVLWLAEIWRRRGWLQDARTVYRQLRHDPGFREPRLRAEAMLGLSEVELQLNDRDSALRHARAAEAAAKDSPSLALLDRATRHLDRCRTAARGRR